MKMFEYIHYFFEFTINFNQERVIMKALENYFNSLYVLKLYEEDGPDANRIASLMREARIYDVPIMELDKRINTVLLTDSKDILRQKASQIKPADFNLPANFIFISTDWVFASLPNKPWRLTRNLGYFISKEEIYGFSIQVNANGTDEKMYLSYVYRDGEWLGDDKELNPEGFGLRQYVMTESLSIINGYLNTVIYKSTYKRQMKRNKRFKRFDMPSYYYTIDLKNRIVKKAESSTKGNTGKSFEKSYAYDVRGHYKCHIKTGELPIDPEIEKLLRKDPRRKIFMSPSEIDDEYRVILTKREYEIKEGYWYSILKTYYNGFIANSKGGKNPYIPSIHVCK